MDTVGPQRHGNALLGAEVVSDTLWHFSGQCSLGAAPVTLLAHAIGLGRSSMMRVPPATQAAHAHQVVGGKAQQRLARELGMANGLGLGQTAHCLGPAKGLLDAHAHLLTGLVALVPLGATVHRRVLVLGRPDSGPLVPVAPALQHGPCRLTFGGATGVGDLHVHDEPVSVLHEDMSHMSHVAQARLVALALIDEQPGVSIRGAGVGVVATLLAFEVHLGVAPGWRAAVIVLAVEAVVRCPGLNQPPIYHGVA